MEWYFILALAITIPIIVFPVAFVWYLNLGGIYAANKSARARKVILEKANEVKVTEKQIED